MLSHDTDGEPRRWDLYTCPEHGLLSTRREVGHDSQPTYEPYCKLCEGGFISRPTTVIEVAPVKARLLALYRPNVQQGNFQADVWARGGNDMLIKVLTALDIPEDRIRAEFKRLDDEAYDRQQAVIDRLEAERAEGAR